MTIEQLETGPPIGEPVQIRLFGDDAETLRKMAAETKRQLREIPGADNIHDDWDAETFEMPVTIKTDKANLAGVTNEDVAMLLQTSLSGVALTNLREQDRLIPITIRLRSDERSRVEEIGDLDVVSSATNARVPIGQIVDLSVRLAAPKIWRRDHQRCITVMCDVTAGVLASSIVRQMAPRLTSAARPGRPAAASSSAASTKSRPRASTSVGLALLASLAGDLPGLGLPVQQRHQAAGGVCRRAVRNGGRHDGLVSLRHALWFHGLSRRGVVGRRDRQPRHRACSTISKRPASAASRCGRP